VRDEYLSLVLTKFWLYRRPLANLLMIQLFVFRQATTAEELYASTANFTFGIDGNVGAAAPTEAYTDAVTDAEARGHAVDDDEARPAAEDETRTAVVSDDVDAVVEEEAGAFRDDVGPVGADVCLAGETVTARVGAVEIRVGEVEARADARRLALAEMTSERGCSLNLSAAATSVADPGAPENDTVTGGASACARSRRSSST
jgi:hypothetical protein